MKKISTVLMLFVLSLTMCACGNKSESSKSNTKETNLIKETKAEEIDTKYKVGEKVSTDIFDFTLNSAELAIACSDDWGDASYLLPKEYDAVEDEYNRYVAAKGETMVALNFTIKNNDRKGHEYGVNSSQVDMPFEWKIIYEGNKYRLNRSAPKYLDVHEVGPFEIDAVNALYNGECIEFGADQNAPYIKASDEENIITCGRVSVSIDDLNSPFDLVINLLNSDGEFEYFTYHIGK